MRRFTCAGILALLALGVAACSGSESKGSATMATSTTASPSDTTAPTTTEATGLALTFADDGTVDSASALAALSLAIGPIGGVPAPPAGTVGEFSASGPYRWVAKHWGELDAATQQAVSAALDAAMPAGNTASGLRRGGFGDDPGTGQYRQLVDADVAAIGASLGRSLVMPTAVLLSPDPDPGGAFAAASHWDTKGNAFPGCKIWIFPKAKNAGANLAFLVAHEVFHCFQMDLVSFAQYVNEPAWVMEGQASWVGLEVAGPAEVMTDATSPGLMDHWRGWLQEPDRSLPERAYDAIGFYSVLKDTGANVWGVLDSMLTAGSSAGAYQAAVGGVEPTVAGRWASSLFRENQPCCSWDLKTAQGATPKALAPPPTHLINVDNGDSEDTDQVASLAAALYQLDARADVVTLGVNGFSRVSDGTFDVAPAPGQLVDLCTRTDGCVCPDGTQPRSTVDVNGTVRWAVGGGGLPALGSAVGQSLEDWCTTETTTTIGTGGTGLDACDLLPPDEVLAETGITLPPVLASDVTALDSCLYNDGSGSPPSYAVQMQLADPPLTSLPVADMAQADCAAFGGGYTDGPGYYACVPPSGLGVFVRTVHGTAIITTTDAFTPDQANGIVKIVVRHLR